MPATEKDQFIQSWEREFQTTVKILKHYPADKLALKPVEKSRSAKDLAWTFAIEEQTLMGGALKGQIDFQNMPQAPATMAEIISGYERIHKEMVEKVRKMSDSDFNTTMKFMTGPKQTSDVRKADILWMSLMDSIHHRGQLSVYIRMAGGKVPSIYGPSGDEPWM
jgi:uncharacterized damage-inducible protein DinB